MPKGTELRQRVKQCVASYGDLTHGHELLFERAIMLLLNEEVARRDDMIRQLRMTLGMFEGAQPVTPQAVWEEALRAVQEHVAFVQAVARDFPAVFGRCWNA